MSAERVNQLWPSDLKSEVLTLVGKRGLTAFTLEAVREKLERIREQPDEPVSQEDDAPPPAKTEERVAAEVAHAQAVDNYDRLVQAEKNMDAADEGQVIEIPPAAINPIPAAVVETPKPVTRTCEIDGIVLDEGGFCWLCGVSYNTA